MFPLLPFPSPREVVAFALVLSRVAGIFTAMPVFGGRRLPIQLKAITVLMVTLVCFPSLNIQAPAIPLEIFTLGLLLLREMAIGLMIALITQIIFAAIEFGGQIVGMQMGFSISQILDPTMGNQAQIMAVLQTLLATLLFFSLNIHHIFIHAIVDSFSVIPIGSWHISGEIITFLIARTLDVFTIGVRLAAPVMVSLLLTSVALGIMARAFPQMNIFMVSLPLNIGIGFIVLGMTIMVFFHVLEVSFGQLKGHIDTLYRLMAKG